MSFIDHAFKAGDRVKAKSGYVGTIRSASGHYSNGQPIYYVDFDHNWIGSDVMQESELSLYEEAAKPELKAHGCECGAAHTTSPNLHSRWCPKYGRN